MMEIKRIVLKWLGSAPRLDFNPKRVHRIIVFRYDRIGDMMVTIPLLRGLHRSFPSAAIDLLCSKLNAPVAEGLPGISERISHRPSLVGLVQLMTLRKRRYDLVVDLNHSVIWYDLLAIRALRPMFAVSVHKEGRYGVTGRELTLYCLMANRHPMGMHRPISSVYLDLLQALTGDEGPSRYGFEPKVSPAEFDSARMHAGLSKSELVIGVNQHGGRPSMALRNDDVVLLCRLVLKLCPDCTILLFTGPSTYEHSLLLSTELDDNRVKVWRPTPSIRPVIAVMREIKLLLTPDTSLVHIAAAYRVPVVAVYANEPELIAQWAPEHTYLRTVKSSCAKSLEGYSTRALLKEAEIAMETIGLASTH